MSEPTEDPFPMYETAWHRAESEGAVVHFDGLADFAGYFTPSRPKGRRFPTIYIKRPYYQEGRQPTRARNAGAPPNMPPPDIMDELITLAHEYGHFRSWKDRTPGPEWELYDAVASKRDAADDAARERLPKGLSNDEFNGRLRVAMWEALTDDERARVVAEEELAWALGRDLLSELGFQAWGAFDERQRRGVHYHRYRLGMEDAWPDDE